jgi:2-polyprenyl-6-hydroxyphenyl methylase/3-demethylubiquinone-9 3-methyltransferase
MQLARTFQSTACRTRRLSGCRAQGTHHWEDFITPDEFEALLAEAGLTVTAKRGIAWRPGKGLHLSDDTALNYILSARRA